MRKILISIIVALFLAAPLMAFSCFGIEEGFTKQQCEDVGAEFLEISKDYGTYQVWMFEPSPINRSSYFDCYYAYIDRTFGVIKVIAYSEPQGDSDSELDRVQLKFNQARWDYGRKYGLKDEDIENQETFLTIGEAAGEEKIMLMKNFADSTFLEDTRASNAGEYDPILAVIYIGKSFYDAMTIYDLNQQAII